MADAIGLTPAQVTFLRKYLPDFSAAGHDVALAGQAGSMRSFVRIKPATGKPLILVVWDGKDEDWSRYLSIPEELRPYCAFLPEIYGADARHGLILEEDLGAVTLHRYCRGRSQAEVESMYRAVLDSLCVWQNLAVENSPSIGARKMDLETFLWETDYFARRCVVDFCGCEKLLDAGWEKERLALAAAASLLPQTFIHRDFQSENIMIMDDKIRYVDFQGARLGPPAYDVASLLFDPYQNMLGDELVDRLYPLYASLPLRVKFDEHTFFLCAAQRLMQALGAYGNLSIHKGKTRYREFVPVALKRLGRVMEKLPEYKAIGSVAGECLKVL